MKESFQSTSHLGGDVRFGLIYIHHMILMIKTHGKQYYYYHTPPPLSICALLHNCWCPNVARFLWMIEKLLPKCVIILILKIHYFFSDKEKKISDFFHALLNDIANGSKGTMEWNLIWYKSRNTFFMADNFNVLLISLAYTLNGSPDLRQNLTKLLRLLLWLNTVSLTWRIFTEGRKRESSPEENDSCRYMTRIWLC